jgi:TPP-dependent pyruvate/acetoin dehydrogenase alpha subunit
MNEATLHDLYRMMTTIRRFEAVACEQLIARKIPASLHASIGQEAVATGICAVLQPSDMIVSNHRGHGHCLAKGTEPRLMMAELMGKAAGTNSGRGGSMHVADPSLGILGANGIVGAGLPISVGAAYACGVRGSREIVACFYGDGASNEGACHEAMNIAALWRLPLLFVCENNGYAEMTPQSAHAPIQNLAIRAAGYGMPGETVDGNDVLAVRAVAEVAAERARDGGGPTLIECKTYRVRGHFEGDPQRYKPAGEGAEWKKRDPIDLFRAYLTGACGIDAAELDEIDKRVDSVMAEAVAFADAAEFPGADEVARHVYAEAGRNA